MSAIVFSRTWAMPNPNTFSVKPIGEFVQRYLKASNLSVDPFARDKRWATYTNDLNPSTQAEYHMEAREFLRKLKKEDVVVDLVIFDPPYSPRQVSECYRSAGLKATMVDTQDGRMVRECRDTLQELTVAEAVCLSFGWNTNGMGKRRGWEITEIMLVSHGGRHNDTICIAERRVV